MPKNKRASDVMFCFTRHNRATFHYAECQPTPDQARVVPSLSARLRRGRAASHGARLISDYANRDDMTHHRDALFFSLGNA